MYHVRKTPRPGTAFILMLVFSRVDYHVYAKYAWPVYILSNLLLIATRFIGRTINGARRWIYIGPISFQPAELAKLAEQIRNISDAESQE